ncbi:MAG: trimethylamine methyltransferase family protein [Anaerolineales bacterium]|nr:trimethylamine methyltransferase family protein [Anaerolineales bacterium]
MNDVVISTIHDRSLEVLSRVGLVWPDEFSLEKLERQGFKVDKTTMTVRMTPEQVLSALDEAPKKVDLYPRDQVQPLSFGSGSLLMGAGTGVAVIDPNTGKRRPSTAWDVVQLVKIQDVLPNIDIPRPIITATDSQGKHSGLVEFALALCNTTKHVHHRVLAPEDVDLLVEISQAVTGDRYKPGERPIFSGVYCPLSPLSFTRDNAGCMLRFAYHKIPFQVLSQTLLGANAPPTMLGCLIVTNAEVLGALTIIQALYPGAPVMYGGIITPVDMRTGLVTYGTPEIGVLHSYSGQMARHYGLVSIQIGMRTDAKQPDVQAGFEKMLNLWSVLPNADIIYGAGNLDTGLTCDYDQLVLDDELMSAVRRQQNWLPEGDGKLEVDLIEQAGAGGNFIAHKLTARAARKFWYPKYFVRGDYESWNTNRHDARYLAHIKVKEILESKDGRSVNEENLEIKRIVSIRTGREFADRAFAF